MLNMKFNIFYFLEYSTILNHVTGSMTPVGSILLRDCIFITDLSIISSKIPFTLTPGILPNFFAYLE